MSVKFIFIYVTSKTEVAMFQAVDSKHKNYIKCISVFSTNFGDNTATCG